MNKTLILWIAILFLFAGGSIIWFASKQISTESSSAGSVKVVDEAGAIDPKDKLQSFEFTDQLGKSFSSEELKGKVWIGSFFFADCPSLCVVQNNSIAKLHQRFKDSGLEIVSISVTPEKDPPHKLKNYASRFSADHEHWKFLTGKSVNYAIRVANDFFGLAAAEETHTAEAALFDRDGNLIEAHSVIKPVEYAKLVKLIESHLAQDENATSEEAPIDKVPTDEAEIVVEENEEFAAEESESSTTKLEEVDQI